MKDAEKAINIQTPNPNKIFRGAVLVRTSDCFSSEIVSKSGSRLSRSSIKVQFLLEAEKSTQNPSSDLLSTWQ